MNMDMTPTPGNGDGGNSAYSMNMNMDMNMNMNIGAATTNVAATMDSRNMMMGRQPQYGDDVEEEQQAADIYVDTNFGGGGGGSGTGTKKTKKADRSSSSSEQHSSSSFAFQLQQVQQQQQQQRPRASSHDGVLGMSRPTHSYAGSLGFGGDLVLMNSSQRSVDGTSRGSGSTESTSSMTTATAGGGQYIPMDNSFHSQDGHLSQSYGSGGGGGYPFPQSQSTSLSPMMAPSLSSSSSPTQTTKPQRLLSETTSTGIPAFPWKLHDVLEDSERKGFTSIVSWQMNGRAFKVHDQKLFESQIMTRYFNQTMYKSFQRQLNIYGFQRVTSGECKGSYTHDLLVRGKPDICRFMVRTKIKKKGSKSGNLIKSNSGDNLRKMQASLRKNGHGNRGSMSRTSNSCPDDMMAAAMASATISSSFDGSGNNISDGNRNAVFGNQIEQPPTQLFKMKGANSIAAYLQANGNSLSRTTGIGTSMNRNVTNGMVRGRGSGFGTTSGMLTPAAIATNGALDVFNSAGSSPPIKSEENQGMLGGELSIPPFSNNGIQQNNNAQNLQGLMQMQMMSPPGGRSGGVGSSSRSSRNRSGLFQQLSHEINMVDNRTPLMTSQPVVAQQQQHQQQRHNQLAMSTDISMMDTSLGTDDRPFNYDSIFASDPSVENNEMNAFDDVEELLQEVEDDVNPVALQDVSPFISTAKMPKSMSDELLRRMFAS